MDVRLSVEQVALRDSAAQAVERLGPKAVGQLGEDGRVAKLDAVVAGSGWRELRAATDGGTPLATGVEVCLVAEELGRGLADAPFLGPTLAAEFRRRAGAPPSEVAETVCLGAGLSRPAIASGRTLEPWATAVDAGGGPSALALIPSPGGYELGVLPAGDRPGGADLTRPGRTWTRPPGVTRLAGQLRELSEDDLVGWSSLALAVTCADLVGVMRGALELACGYARERRQYGVPIGAFQALQHLLADAYVSMEGSRSVARHAAWAVDGLPPAEALAATALAKAYCARAARSVCETAIQVHGGIGNTWDCLAHLYLRRALLSIEVLGGVGANLSRVLAHQGLGDGHGLR